ncbi:MAG TPA: hypothetical protein VII85_01320, partial [Candidatus Krumholzibacteriaceae bacterium]
VAAVGADWQHAAGKPPALDFAHHLLQMVNAEVDTDYAGEIVPEEHGLRAIPAAQIEHDRAGRRRKIAYKAAPPDENEVVPLRGLARGDMKRTGSVAHALTS